MRTRLIGLLLLMTSATVLACGDAVGPEDIAGVWNYSETTTDAVHSISCSNTGTINITAAGSGFTGTFNQTGVCTGPGGALDNSGSGNVSGGQVSGKNVSFQVPFCQYQGSFSGSPPNRMTGTSSCTIQEAGEAFNFSGTWQASR